MSRITEVAEWIDAHSVATFDLTAGSYPRGTEFRYRETVMGAGLLISEINSSVVGDEDDVDGVLDFTSIALWDDGRDLKIFERPTSVLALMDARNRDTAMEDRVARLERMMNVLVEQDSPAGEALRRLGGAKIEHSSPTRLPQPQLFQLGHRLIVILKAEGDFALAHDVQVRVSLIGTKKRIIL